MVLAEYACAIISVDEGEHQGFLLEERGPDARYAAGRRTCFGGRVEDGETSHDCLIRELQEELHWQSNTLMLACTLWYKQRYIADFYCCHLDCRLEDLHCETGRDYCILNKQELDHKDSRVSPWHRAVFAAYFDNKKTVHLSSAQYAQ